MISLFEDAGVIRLQAVENLATDGHDALKFRVARALTEPMAESPSTIYSSRRLASRLRQSTNFCTRLAMSRLPESFF